MNFDYKNAVKLGIFQRSLPELELCYKNSSVQFCFRRTEANQWCMRIRSEKKRKRQAERAGITIISALRSGGRTFFFFRPRPMNDNFPFLNTTKKMNTNATNASLLLSYTRLPEFLSVKQFCSVITACRPPTQTFFKRPSTKPLFTHYRCSLPIQQSGLQKKLT